MGSVTESPAAPWDRYCVSPPTMTSQEVQARLAEARQQDDEARAVAMTTADSGDPAFPMRTLLTAMTLGGRDRTAPMCPVFALRLRSSNGRAVVDHLKAYMQDDARAES